MKKVMIALLTVALLLSSLCAATAEEERDYKDLYPESLVYEGLWKTGDWQVESYCEDGGFKLNIKHQLTEEKYTVWEYSALYNTEDKTLVCVPFGLKYTVDENIISELVENEYEDGDAVFSLNAEGKLLWKDLKEDAGNGLAFENIGWFLDGIWSMGKTMVEFVDWQEGEYEIRVTLFDDEGLAVQYGALKGPYNAESNSVTAQGKMDGGEALLTVTFSLNEDGQLVWTNEAASEVIVFSADDTAG